jgi:hypothetical protein
MPFSCVKFNILCYRADLRELRNCFKYKLIYFIDLLHFILYSTPLQVGAKSGEKLGKSKLPPFRLFESLSFERVLQMAPGADSKKRSLTCNRISSLVIVAWLEAH